MLAEKASKENGTVRAKTLKGMSSKICSVSVTVNKKDVSLSKYSGSDLKILRVYKKNRDVGVAVNDIAEYITADKSSPVYISFSGVDKGVAEAYASQLSASGFTNVSTSQNKSLKANGMVAVYYCNG